MELKKKNFLKNPTFYYWLFVILATLELIVSVLVLIFDFSDFSRDVSIGNIFLSLLAISLMTIPRILKERFHFKFKPWLEILILFFIFASIVLGFIQDFYVHVKGYDKLVHAISGIVLSLIAFEIVHIYSSYIAKKKNQIIPPFFIILFSFTLSITLLVLWEFYEFFVDTISYNLLKNSTNMQRYQWSNNSTIYPQGYGLLDTMLDLLLGALGAFIVSLILFFVLRKDEKNRLNKIEAEDKKTLS